MLQSCLFGRILSVALFALALSAMPPAQAATAGDPGLIAQDIASAGRLRMQSQRLAKLYQQAAMGMVGAFVFFEKSSISVCA